MTVMTDKERQNLIAFMEDFKKKVAGNREMSLQFLAEVGICTLDGKLTDPYKHLYIPPVEAM